MLKRCLVAIALVSNLGACVTSSGQHDTNHDPYHGTAVKWHQGTIEQAFALAKQQQRAVLLYWGAVWCPSCNELKAEVFSKPEFRTLMTHAIPVYLNGDSEYAQTWGELFQITGYPTVLVLDHEKRELMRISESLSFDEFSAAFEGAVQSARPFQQTMARALNGEATETDWRLLAYFAWYGARSMDVHAPSVLAKRKQLADTVPAELIAERALLSARLLESASAGNAPPSDVRDAIRADAGRYINAIMFDEAARYAARSTLLTGHNIVLNWAYADDAASRQLMSDKWTVATTRLRTDARLSNDQRLWTWYPEIQAAYLRAGSPTELPSALVNNVKAAVSTAVAAAKTEFETHATISSAAYLLQKIGEFDAAADLLLTEAKRSATPYYYYSSLAQLEVERNNRDKALEYARLASKSAAGRATKLQWLVSDMKMTAQFGDASKKERLMRLADEFYNQLFSAKDGFDGRSYRSTKRAGRILSEIDLNAEFRRALDGYSARCGRLKDRAKLRCQDHFASVLGTQQHD